MIIKFSKVEGLGNDFILIEKKYLKNELSINSIKKICNRNFGIGADGIIILDKNDLSVKFLNTDGSSAKMCGNGLRCASYYLFKKYNITTSKIKTPAGIYKTEIVNNNIEVIMRKPETIEFNKPIKISGKNYNYHYVNVGNPHIVIDSKKLYNDFDISGKFIEDSKIFSPNGINSNFCFYENNALYIKTWERGVGPTLACGTGSYSCSLVFFDKHPNLNEIKIILPGGILYFKKKNNNIFMNGPANIVFKGEIEIFEN